MTSCLKQLFAFILMLVSAPSAHAQEQGPLVLAAASLQDSLSQAADVWARKGHPRPILSFAASSALARQIESGARADLFISADVAWMDYVASKGMLRPRSRAPLLSNRLVLVASRSNPLRLPIEQGFPLVRALGNGRLALADPATVPAGKYAKAALTKLGIWPAVESRLARAENVRAALALVERGQSPLGIVYATDARASKQVRVVGVFPLSSHPPITYQIATLTASTNRTSDAFRRFLFSPEGKAIFMSHGFAAK